MTIGFLAGLALLGCGESPAESQRSVPKDGCDNGGLTAGEHRLSLEYGGQDYGYVVYIPAQYADTERSPLVLNWHSYTSNAALQQELSEMDAVADATGMIVVYPDSPAKGWNAGTCCGAATNRDDVGFARALVQVMQDQTCVDANRVYSMGMSNGGYMSHRLACEAADVFAAIVSVAGVVGVDDCHPSRPVPVLQMHGVADSVVPYTGGGFANGYDRERGDVVETMQGWAQRNGCAEPPVQTFAEADVVCGTWRDCDAETEVQLCTFEALDHCWPGWTSCRFGEPSTTLRASEEAANFFDRFHR